jgi:hypothetical protein
VARRLDDMKSGSSQYLKVLLNAIQEHGLNARLIFAPERSFGNRPWAKIDAEITDIVDVALWPGAVKLGNLYCSLSFSVWLAFLKRVLFGVRAGLAGNPRRKPSSLLGYELNQVDADNLIYATNQSPSSLVIAEYSSLGPLLEKVHTPRKAILLHDLFSLRANSFSESDRAPDHISISIEDEVARCKHADFLLHAGMGEKALMAEQLPKAQHLWMQPTFSQKSYAINPKGQPRAVYLGADHAGSVEALEHLVAIIWPKVRAELKDAELWVVGDVGRAIDKGNLEKSGIRIMGRLNDLGTIGGEQSIGLAPTLSASGISIKVLDYLNLEMPTLVFPLAIDGYGGLLDNFLEVAHDDRDFVGKCVLLLQDHPTRQKLSSGAKDGVAAVIAAGELSELFSSLD